MNKTKAKKFANELKKRGKLVASHSLENGNTNKTYRYKGESWLVGFDPNGKVAIIRNIFKGENVYIRSDVKIG